MMLLAMIALFVASMYLIYITNWPLVANRALHWGTAIGLYALFENFGIKDVVTKLVKGLA